MNDKNQPNVLNRSALNRSERVLIGVLRGSGVILLTAIFTAAMPFSWMQDVHHWLGMGDLPQQPITEYLTRSLSAFYALHGAIVLFVSFDVRRYLPIIKCLAWLGIAFGLAMLVLDWAVKMPHSWALFEGPFIVILGGLILWLTARTTDAHSPASSAVSQ